MIRNKTHIFRIPQVGEKKSQIQLMYLKLQWKENSMDDQKAKSLPPLILGPSDMTYKGNTGTCRMGYLLQCILCYGPESLITLYQGSTSHCIQRGGNLYPYKTAAVVTFKQKDLSNIGQMAS